MIVIETITANWGWIDVFFLSVSAAIFALIFWGDKL